MQITIVKQNPEGVLFTPVNLHIELPTSSGSGVAKCLDTVISDLEQQVDTATSYIFNYHDFVVWAERLSSPMPKKDIFKMFTHKLNERFALSRIKFNPVSLSPCSINRTYLVQKRWVGAGPSSL